MGDLGAAWVAGILGLVFLCVGMVAMAVAVQDHVWNDFYDHVINYVAWIAIIACFGIAATCFLVTVCEVFD